MGKRWRYGLASVTDSQTTPTRLRQHNHLMYFTSAEKHAEASVQLQTILISHDSQQWRLSGFSFPYLQ